MNKYLRFFSLLLALVWGIDGGLCLHAQVLNWEYEDILSDTYQSGARPDMVIDPAGNIHISYWQKETDQLMSGFRAKNSGTWTIDKVSQNNTEGYTSAILVDPQGFVHIAYVAKILDSAYLAYAQNTSGLWNTQIISNQPSIGVYGADQAAPGFIQHSLDIALQPDGKPAILFFDGRINAVSNCGAPVYQTYSNYELDLNLALNTGSGTWNIHRFADIADDEGSGCLPDGDRFGEFCKILPGTGGKYYAITNSLHNHDLLFYTSAPGNLTNWTLTRVDSSHRYFSVRAAHFREGFDYIDAKLDSDHKVHLAYGISALYGNSTSEANRKTFFYSAINPDSLGAPGYSGFHRLFVPTNVYRTYYSIATPTPDHIFLTYYSANAGRIVVANSLNGGNTWVHDSIMKVITNAQTRTEYFGDSLFVMIYDAQNDMIRLASRSLSSAVWRFENATISESSGVSLGSEIVRKSNEDEVYLAYSERLSGQVFLASRINQTWTKETISPPGIKTDNADLAIYQGSPVVSYREVGSDALQVAFRQNNVWSINTVTLLDAPRDMVIGVRQDSIFLAYFDLKTGGLKLARAGNVNGPWITQTIDASSAIVGRNISMTFDQQGNLHLSYVDVLNGLLKYARRSVSGQWQVESASISQPYVPANTSIKTNSKDLPLIAFRSSADNTMVLAEKDSLGIWSFSNIKGSLTNLVGAPLRLLVDGKDKPWVLYNFVDARDELRLVRRDNQGNWNSVSVLNNQAEISTVFDFHLVENDFYIVGKKNQIENLGLGMLYAKEGVFTNLNAEIVQSTFEIYPNPSQGQIQISFSLNGPEPVTVEVYNLSGQRVHSILNHQTLTSGLHQFEATPTGISPGIYLVRLRIAGYSATKKWVLLP
ncbi:MAG: T9SS type A sorting domain-containing protein [Bacteroidia bacterium]